MIVIEGCIRDYYYINGNFDGIESEKYYSFIQDRAHRLNMSEIDYMYSLLGYKGSDTLTPKQMHDIRKNNIQGKVNYLKEEFNVSSDIELAETLDRLGCLGVTPQIPIKVDNKYVDLLSYYFLNNDSLKFDTTNGSQSVLDLFNYMSTLTTKKEIDQFIKSDNVKMILKFVTPKMVYKEGLDEPVIMLGCLYTSEKLTQKEYDGFAMDAFSQAAFRLDKTTIPNIIKLKKLADYYLFELPFNKQNACLQIIDMANGLNLTVKELYEYSGLNFVSTIGQVKDMNCVVLLTSNGVKIYSYRSANIGECIICKNEYFKILYEKDYLKTLTFINGLGYVTTSNGRIPVSNLFRNEITNTIV